MTDQQWDADGFLQSSYQDEYGYDEYNTGYDNYQYDNDNTQQTNDTQFYSTSYDDFDDVDTAPALATNRPRPGASSSSSSRNPAAPSYTRPRPGSHGTGFTRPRPPTHPVSQQQTQFVPARPRPQATSGPIGGSIGDAGGGGKPNADFGSAVSGMIGGVLQNQGMNAAQAHMVQAGLGVGMSKLRQYVAPSVMSFAYYKYWFRVDTMYVSRKLRLIFFPFLHKNWERVPDPINDVYPYLPPRDDLNAPDFYIPLMSIVTYVVMMGFVVGLRPGGSFSPQVLLGTGSSAFGMLVIEVLLMKLGFYLVGAVATPPFWLDLVCYTGYKLPIVVVNLTCFLFIRSNVFYYVVSVSTGLICAFFMVKTMGFYFSDLQDISGFIQSRQNAKSSNVFLLCVGVLQIIFIQIMGRYSA